MRVRQKNADRAIKNIYVSMLIKVILVCIQCNNIISLFLSIFSYVAHSSHSVYPICHVKNYVPNVRGLEKAIELSSPNALTVF